jgi:hypothetical protein
MWEEEDVEVGVGDGGRYCGHTTAVYVVRLGVEEEVRRLEVS